MEMMSLKLMVTFLVSLFFGLSMNAAGRPPIFIDSFVAQDGISGTDLEKKLKDALAKMGQPLQGDKKLAKVVITGRAFNAEKNTTIVVKISINNDSKVFAETESVAVGGNLDGAIQSLAIKISNVIGKEAVP